MHSAHDLLTRWPALDVAAKRARLQDTFQLSPGPLRDACAAHAEAAERAAAGLWRRDPSVWSSDAAVQQTIANRLGWLDSPALMADSIPRLAGVRVCGSPRRVHGRRAARHGRLEPRAGSAARGARRRAGLAALSHARLDRSGRGSRGRHAPARTLYILASKSGTTIEPNSLAAHFRHGLEERVPSWNDHFVAITDEGTELANRARSEHFRDVFINPSDIGGRYSALSFFGLVPAALMGQDVAAIVGWALAMLAACEPGFGEVTAHPAAALGLAMGAAARAGRDKLTLLLPPALEPFGLWVEQLVAESTGKEGVGVVPIAGEPLGPEVYGSDRFFVRLRLHGSYAEEMRDTDVRDLKDAGAPVGEIELPEPSALGAEFVRWEVATAVAGALLGINPVRRAERAAGQGRDANAARHLRGDRRSARAAARSDAVTTG